MHLSVIAFSRVARLVHSNLETDDLISLIESNDYIIFTFFLLLTIKEAHFSIQFQVQLIFKTFKLGYLHMA